MAGNIYDVAKKADVSISTVSRVLNNRGRISRETEKRVLAAIAALEFIPNINASGLAKSRSDIVGAFIFGFDDLSVPDSYTIEFLNGIQQGLTKKGSSLLIINSSEECLRLMKTKRMDGLIIHNLNVKGEIEEYIDQSGFPAVFTGERFSDSRLDIYYDFEKYMSSCFEKLTEKGHKEICTVFYAEEEYELSSKIGIYERTYRKYELNYSEQLSLVNGAFDKDNVYLNIADRINKGITAFIADSPYFAQQVIDGAKMLQISIPEELSVICMEYEKDAGAWLHPPIDGMFIPSYDLGNSCANMLLARIEKSADPICKLEFEPAYSAHGSVRPCRG